MSASIRHAASIALAVLAVVVPTLAAVRRTPTPQGRCISSFLHGRRRRRHRRAHLADELGKRWLTNIIVDNRPGAGGHRGGRYRKAGRTAIPLSWWPAATDRALSVPKLPYDIFADFAPLTLLGSAPNLAVVRADSPIKTIPDLIAAARAKPGQLSYGHSGNGTSAHLAAELFKAMAKIDIVSVPYKGGVPALNDFSAVISRSASATFRSRLRSSVGNAAGARRDHGTALAALPMCDLR